ncbi:hypothetical protein PsSCT_43500 [Pseudomonas sp. SCT]
MTVRKLAGFTIKHQQTTCTPLRQGMSRDEGVGQLEEKISDLHGQDSGRGKGRKSYPKGAYLTTPND